MSSKHFLSEGRLSRISYVFASAI